MRLIPPIYDPGPKRTNCGERHVFEMFAADRKHPDWIVFHSLDIARHRSQMQGEIDFLVVAPGLGVLVLEVKGWHDVERKGGRWRHDDEKRWDCRGPFKQASEATHSLRDSLVQRRGLPRGVPFWSAVCFPFATFTERSEEWHSWQVIDEPGLRQRPLAEWVEFVLRQARRRAADLHEPWFHAPAREPTVGQCKEIVERVRGDFAFFETAKDRSQRAEVEIRHYTEEQFEALDIMEDVPRVIFDGPAGTGKTLLALEAARRSRARGKNVLVLCFDRAQAIWLEDQGGGPADVDHGPLIAYRSINFHMDALAGHAEKPPYSDRDYWDKELPDAATYQLLANSDVIGRNGRSDPGLHIFDELIVDEAQDVLREGYMDVLDNSVLGGLESGIWRMFGDFAGQTIYGSAIPLDKMRASYDCTIGRLGCNCRNTPIVASLATGLAGRTPVYRKVRRADDGERPVVETWRTGEEQTAVLEGALDGLWRDGFTEPDVVVLTVRPHIAEGAAAKVHREPWCSRLEPLDDPNILKPHPGKIRYSTVRRFRGLEAAVVVLTDVEVLDDDARTLLYVGATRATQRLIVLSHTSVANQLGRMSREPSVPGQAG